MLFGDGDNLTGHDWGWVAVLLTALAGVVSALVAALNKYLPVRGQEQRKQMSLEARLQQDKRDQANRERDQGNREWQEIVDRQQRQLDRQEAAAKTLAERMEKMYAEVRTLLAAQADCLVKNERLSSRIAVMEAMLKRTQDEVAARDVGTYVDAIIVADQYGTIRQWNEAATVLFQWMAHEAIGRHVQVLIPDEGREEHNKRWLDIINPGTSESIRRGPYIVEAVNKSGERFPAEIILSSWLDQGRRFVTASIRKAITDRLGRTLAQMPNPAQSAISAAAQEIVESISSSRLRKANEAQAPVQQQTPKETEDVDLGQ